MILLIVVSLMNTQLNFIRFVSKKESKYPNFCLDKVNILFVKMKNSILFSVLFLITFLSYGHTSNHIYKSKTVTPIVKSNQIFYGFSSEFLIKAVAKKDDNIHYNDLFQPDNRLKVSIHHNRTIGLGAQFVGVQIINVGKNKVKVELEYYVDLTCGERITRKIGFGGGLYIKPGDTLKPSGFFDTDNTSFDAGNSRSSSCMASPNKSKKIDDASYTCIEGVGFNIISVSEYDEKGVLIQSSSNTSSSNSSSSNNSNTNAENNNSTLCPYGNFSFTSQWVKENCATFFWLNQSPTLTANKDSSLTTNGDYPADFIIQYKTENSTIWNEMTVNGYGGNFTIDNLEPCENYQVRMQRNCGNGNKSLFTSTFLFTTLCHTPSFLKSANISNTSVKISYVRMQIDCGHHEEPIYVLEYKLGGSSAWNTKIFTADQEKILTNLKSGAQYQIRAKCQYSNGKYSPYSKVEIFQVMP